MNPGPPSEFKMTGAQEILDLYGSSFHLQQHINNIQIFIEKNPDAAIESSKALIESTCKTILQSSGWPYKKNSDMQELIKSTMKLLELEFDDSKIAVEFTKSAKSVATIVHSIATIRNATGQACHGKEFDYHPFNSPESAIFVARMADSLVHFLYMAHKGFPRTKSAKKIDYAKETKFNSYLDDKFGNIQLGAEFVYEASEVIYSLDYTAYEALYDEETWRLDYSDVIDLDFMSDMVETLESNSDDKL